jgi:hypothetical protein
MESTKPEQDYAYLSEIAQLEQVVVIVAEEYPEVAGLLKTLLGDGELERMQADESKRHPKS